MDAEPMGDGVSFILVQWSIAAIALPRENRSDETRDA